MNLDTTLDRLRAANIRRLPLFKNRRGEPAHSQSDGSDWSLAEWTNAVAGEVGEACNLAKKLQRGDFGPFASPGYNATCGELAHELADVVIYADIACFRAGGSLREEIAKMRHLELQDRKSNNIAEMTNRIASKIGSACEIADGLTRGDLGAPGSEHYTNACRVLIRWLAAVALTAESASEVAGRSLNAAIIEKFNIVSDRVGCEVRL